MADELTASAWTGFLKKLKPEPDLDDGPLVKALAKLDKAPDSKPELQLEALAELDTILGKQVSGLASRKKALGDNHDTIKKKLEGLLKDASARHKETERVIQAMKASAAEEEDESPTILTTKMIPLLKEVRKPDVVLQSLIAVAGKETVVLMSRRAISSARGKVLKDAMTNSSGLKFHRAEVLLEKNAVTFVMENVVAGLAKKISAALKAQTELRVKVRVRGEDPDEAADEDLEAPDPEPEVTVHVGQPTQQPEPETDPLKARFDKRMKDLKPQLANLSQATGSTDATNARALLAFAQEKAKPSSYAAALKALDALEPLLVAATATPVEPKSPADLDLGKPGRAGLMAIWRTERAGAISTLKQLATRIGKAGHKRSAPAIEEIKTVIDRLVAEPATKKQATDLQAWLATDDLVLDICELEEDIQTPLTKALKALEPELTA